LAGQRDKERLCELMIAENYEGLVRVIVRGWVRVHN